MRLNQYLARFTPLSRRGADKEIEKGSVTVNGIRASVGASVELTDVVTWQGRAVHAKVETQTILFHKPVGFVCSKQGQGSKTIYDILPPEYYRLNPVGRLDKNSSGLLLLTNDGELANTLTHPSYQKKKVYVVQLNKPLLPLHQQMISDIGVTLSDGPSKLILQKQDDGSKIFEITMHEGRNRQIRRTFEALGYSVRKLHRISIGNYHIADLQTGKTRLI